MVSHVTIPVKNPALMADPLITYYGAGITILKSVSSTTTTSELIFRCPQLFPKDIRFYHKFVGGSEGGLYSQMGSWNAETSTFTTLSDINTSYSETYTSTYNNIEMLIGDTFLMLHCASSFDAFHSTFLLSQTNETVPRYFAGGYSYTTYQEQRIGAKSIIVDAALGSQNAGTEVTLIGLNADWRNSNGKIFTAPLFISSDLEGILYNENGPISLKNMKSCSKVSVKSPIFGENYALLPNVLYTFKGSIGANVLIEYA